MAWFKSRNSKIEISVCHWSEVNSIYWREPLVIILGPGPGHPNEYGTLKPFIQNCLENPDVFVIGVCLGHQLIWQYLGHSINLSSHLVHGQQEEICIPNWNDLFPKSFHDQTALVQRYNSLAVIPSGPFESDQKTLLKRGEIMIGSFSGGVSYQFHPESVGTSCPEAFFDCGLNFLYNKMDESPPESYRHL